MLGFTGHKGPIFYPLAVLALYHILNKEGVITYLLLGYIAVILIAIIDFYVGTAGHWVGSLMLRRTYLTPAELSFACYEFFSRNPFTLWSESKITFAIINYQYDVPSSILVGREVYGVDTLNANTGWIGSGYSNGGFIGMLFYSGIIGSLFSFLNAYRQAIDKRVLVALLVPCLLTLMMSSDLPTAFLNHGVLFALLLFLYFQSQKNWLGPE